MRDPNDAPTPDITFPVDDLTLRDDFPAEARPVRSAVWEAATRLGDALVALRTHLRRQDDREAWADARDDLRGLMKALRDVGTVDPHAEDDRTLGPAADQSGAERARERLAAHASPHCGPTVTEYEDGSLLVDWPDGRSESFSSVEDCIEACDRSDALCAEEREDGV